MTYLRILLMFTAAWGALSYAEVRMPPATTETGYVARLLLNESPFPGERGWTSEADSKACMLQILHVLDSRIRHIPKGYRQSQVAAVTTTDIIEHARKKWTYNSEEERV